MGKRILVAVVCIPLIFLVLFMLPPIFLPIAVSALSMIAVHEVLWSTGFVKNIYISSISIIMAGLVPFWVFNGETMFPALCGLLLYTTMLFALAIFSHFTVTMEKMGGSFFFAIIIPYLLSSFIRLNGLPLGSYLVLLPMVSAFTSDASALFAGMAFGKHKLAPELSPKKTVEGAIGGFLGAICCTMLYGFVIQHFFMLNVNYLYLALFGGLGSLISQFGDLSFSYIKRQYHIKDYGSVFPGHGGVLDRFDSVIFCAPLTEVLAHILHTIWR